MVSRLRVLFSLLIATVAVWLVAASPARADDGTRDGTRGERPQVEDPRRARPAAGRAAAGKKTRNRENVAHWVESRHRELAKESLARTQGVERMRKRLDRDLLSLRRARVALLRCGGKTTPAHQTDRVLVEVGHMRSRVAVAAAKARKKLAAPVSETAAAWRRPQTWVRSSARVSADATRARVRMTRTCRAFCQIVAKERKRVVQLAAENARVASVLLDGPRRPVGEASKRRVSDARRVLQGLKKMGASERRKIRSQLVRDARRIRRTQHAVASIEKRLQEVRRQIRALKAGKPKAGKPKAGKPKVGRPRPVPAVAPADGTGRATRSD